MKQRGPGQPMGNDDVINKYGTYEVQATNGTEHDFPQIAQGMAKEEMKVLREREAHWRKQ